MYKSQLFFKDVLWVVAVHTIKTSWKQKNNIWRLFWRESMGKTQKNKKPRENQQKTIFGDSLGKLYWQNQKNLEKTKKPKNQNCSENVWSEAHVWFFLVLPRFLGVCGFSFFLAAQWKTKKTLSFFGFSHFFNHHFIQKPKKPWVFLVFSRSRQKKTKKT